MSQPKPESSYLARSYHQPKVASYRPKLESEEEITDEIGSDLPPPSEIDESIKESIMESRQSEQKALSSARRMMGSE